MGSLVGGWIGKLNFKWHVDGWFLGTSVVELVGGCLDDCSKMSEMIQLGS